MVSNTPLYSLSYSFSRLLASCETDFCPTAAHDSTPSLNWKPTSSTARNGHSLEQCHAIIECSPHSHPPVSALVFASGLDFLLYHTHMQHMHPLRIICTFFYSVFICQGFSPI